MYKIILISLLIISLSCTSTKTEQTPQKAELSSEDLKKLMRDYFFELGKGLKESEKRMLIMQLEVFYLTGKQNNPGHENAVEDFIDKNNSKLKSEILKMFQNMIEDQKALKKKNE